MDVARIKKTTAAEEVFKFVARAIQKTTGRNLGVQALFDLGKKSSLKEGER